MKRLTQVLGASILAIAATGASQAQQATDWSTKLAKHDGVALRMSTITDPFIDAIKATKDGFTKLTGASVQVDGFGYDALHDQQLLGCTQKDASTDILVIDGIWLGEFVEAGCLAPVEDRLAADPELIAWDDYTPSGQRQASWDGKRYCLPVGIYYGLLFYRTDLFEKAGKTPPKTFDELKELAKFFTNNPDYPGRLRLRHEQPARRRRRPTVFRVDLQCRRQALGVERCRRRGSLCRSDAAAELEGVGRAGAVLP